MPTNLTEQVLSLALDGAAHTSGLIKVGDLIHKVDNQCVYGLNHRDVTGLSQGAPGTDVTLGIVYLNS